MIAKLAKQMLRGRSRARIHEGNSKNGGPGDVLQAEARQKRRRLGGYSLAELMVGSGALTLVMTGMFGALGQASGLAENVRSADFAAQTLLIEMEEVLLMQWEEIEAMGTNSSFDPGTYFSEIPLRNATCARKITDVDPNMKEIRLSISWQDLHGMVHDREFVTYYSKNGLYDFDYTSF